MKKVIILLVSLFTLISANAQSFRKGNMVIDLGVGFGMANVVDTKLTSSQEIEEKKYLKEAITQKLSFEVGVANLTKKSSLGFGVSFNNSYGASHREIATGTYNYMYTVTTATLNSHNRWDYRRTTQTRSGSGQANSTAKVEEFNVMAKLAYHYSFSQRFDTYVGIGFGVSSYKALYSKFTNETGFSRANVNSGGSSQQVSYSYDDLDHVKWEGASPSARFAVGAYIGTRYYFSKHWGINMEAGLVPLSLKKDLNNYSILSVGVSCKF